MSIKAYKGFNHNMTCRDFQYEQGKSYEMKGEVKICERGFHACEYPLDCFSYYSPEDGSLYHEVELDGDIEKVDDDGDTKVCAAKIKIGARLSIDDMVESAVDYMVARVKSEATTIKKGIAITTNDHKSVKAIGDMGIAGATGYKSVSKATGTCCGVAITTGDKGAAVAYGRYGGATATGGIGAAKAIGVCGVASATGYHGAAIATGACGAANATQDRGVAIATSYRGSASATGNSSVASVSDKRGIASVTGDCGMAIATSARSVASATGSSSAASAENPTAVAVAWGFNGKAKGVIGSHIVLAEWDGLQYESFLVAKMVHIDGVKYKPDTWYTLRDGEVVEVAEGCAE